MREQGALISFEDMNKEVESRMENQEEVEDECDTTEEMEQLEIAAISKRNWKIKNKFELGKIADGLYSVKFMKEGDFQFVIDNGPWDIHGHIISFKKWDRDIVLEDFDFPYFPVWIQIFGLPIERQTQRNVQKIGLAFGDVKGIDPVGGAEGKKPFARVQRASSFKFGAGIQKRHVVEVDPLAEMEIEDRKLQDWQEARARREETRKMKLTKSKWVNGQGDLESNIVENELTQQSREENGISEAKDITESEKVEEIVGVIASQEEKDMGNGSGISQQKVVEAECMEESPTILKGFNEIEANGEFSSMDYSPQTKDGSSMKVDSIKIKSVVMRDRIDNQENIGESNVVAEVEIPRCQKALVFNEPSPKPNPWPVDDVLTVGQQSLNSVNPEAHIDTQAQNLLLESNVLTQQTFLETQTNTVFVSQATTSSLPLLVFSALESKFRNFNSMSVPAQPPKLISTKSSLKHNSVRPRALQRRVLPNSFQKSSFLEEEGKKITKDSKKRGWTEIEMASRKENSCNNGDKDRKKQKAIHAEDCSNWDKERTISNADVDCDPLEVRTVLDLMEGSMKRKEDHPEMIWLGKKVKELKKKGFSFAEELKKKEKVVLNVNEGKEMDESYAMFLLANPQLLHGAEYEDVFGNEDTGSSVTMNSDGLAAVVPKQQPPPQC
ncbi:hypothetical protein FRX31_025836 [Thalictrum thalictroides]|uniref:DUF4283 domain-containing protein n=1 Tax=Thalictrum thalictroides TaxID=46969 RepID=A0A7J6VIK2_THATH|nr:hypothetical protein FRX31_025836 [Thalictrum thalictroides]